MTLCKRSWGLMEGMTGKILHVIITCVLLYGFFKIIRFIYNKYIPYSFATDAIGIIIFVIFCIPASLVISHKLLNSAGKY